MQLFQTLLTPYQHMPNYIRGWWERVYPEIEYELLDDDGAVKFLERYEPGNSSVIEGFNGGNGKWKADLLRFCLLSRKPGIYVDLDLKPKRNLLRYIPDVDFVSCIGAHAPKEGITPLPPGELAIGFMYAKSPEPLLEMYINQFGARNIAAGEPYAFNIQNFYAMLCHRWSVERLEPFVTYNDPETKRSYYFIQEKRIWKRFKMVSEKGKILIHSQQVKSKHFL